MKTSATPNAVDAKINNASPAGLNYSKIKISFPLVTTAHASPPLTASNS